MELRKNLRLNKEKATIQMLNLLQDSSLSTQPGPQKSSAVAKVQEKGKFPSLDPSPDPQQTELRELNSTGNLWAGAAPLS